MLTEDNGGVPDKYAGGDALNGQLELVVAAHLPSRCTANGAVAGLSAGARDLAPISPPRLRPGLARALVDRPSPPRTPR